MEIVLYGSQILRKESVKIEKIDDEIRQILNEMVETMRSAKGVGLAANQVGIDKRFFVLEIEEQVKKVVNPEILENIGEIEEAEEGCLSIPGIYKKVLRPSKIKVSYLNEDGEEIIEELDGLWARAFQHELDHLNGVLFVDKISQINKTLIKKKLDQIKKQCFKNKN